MKFVKRLIIMSGEKAKGTLNLERNAYGVFARLNTYGPELYSCDLVLKIDGKFFFRPLNGSRDSFEIDGFAKDDVNRDIDIVHAAIFCDNKLVMYGTNDSKRLSLSQIALFTRQIRRGKTLKTTDKYGSSEYKSGGLFTKADYMGKPQQAGKKMTIDNKPDEFSQNGEYKKESYEKDNSKYDLNEAYDSNNNLYLQKESEDKDNTEYIQSSEKGNNAYVHQNVSEAFEGYVDDLIAEENYYPSSLSNEFENAVAHMRIAEVMDGLSEVAATAKADGITSRNEDIKNTDLPLSNENIIKIIPAINIVEENKQNSTADINKKILIDSIKINAEDKKIDNKKSKLEDIADGSTNITEDKKVIDTNRLSPAYMEQIFVLAGLTSKLPAAEKPTFDKILSKADDSEFIKDSPPKNRLNKNIPIKTEESTYMQNIQNPIIKTDQFIQYQSDQNRPTQNQYEQNQSEYNHCNQNRYMQGEPEASSCKQNQTQHNHCEQSKYLQGQPESSCFGQNQKQHNHCEQSRPSPNQEYLKNQKNFASAVRHHFAKNENHASTENKDKNNLFNSKKPYGRNDSEQSQRIAAIKTDPHISARQGTFFEKNGEEIEKLFSGPCEKELEQILPGSRWVKISYDNSGKYYVIGLIGKQYLCYGVPSHYSPVPPDELNGYCWWLPKIAAEPQGKGYWIMYQSLSTGETILPSKTE